MGVQPSTKVRFHDENIDLTTKIYSCDDGHEFMQITYELHDGSNEKFHDHRCHFMLWQKSTFQMILWGLYFGTFPGN